MTGIPNFLIACRETSPGVFERFSFQERIDGNLHSPSIVQRWSEEDLAAIGLVLKPLRDLLPAAPSTPEA